MLCWIKDIANILQVDYEGPNLEVRGVSIDCRTLEKGDLFIALKGNRYDGHTFIEQAIARGAVGVVTAAGSEAIPTIQLQVEHTGQALKSLAVAHRQKFKGPVVAVTGSCGKSTTKQFIASILELEGPTLSNPGSYNNDIGVPLTLLMLREPHRYLVQELGANHAGEIAELTHMVRPDVAIITQVGMAHLAGFGSLEGIACAKAEIFQGLQETGTAVINNDDQFAHAWRKRLGLKQVVTFGIEYESDIMARHLVCNAQHCDSFELHTPKGTAHVQLPMMGRHNVNNALAAAAAAYALDIPLAKIAQGLSHTQALDMRMRSWTTPSGITLIDDSYNANPSSVLAALTHLAQYPGRKIFVMGEMGELGEQAITLHGDMGLEAKRLGIDQVYGYGALTEYAVDAYDGDGQFFIDQETLISNLKDELRAPCTVLIKGSRSAKMEQVAQALKEI